MKLALMTQRQFLPLVGVLLQCMDADQRPMEGAFASGFIRREGGQLFLYTCWHVVTGFDPNDVKVRFELPRRRYLEIALQSADLSQPHVQKIGGLQKIVVPLYESQGQPFRPLWQQDDRHIPHPDLNAVGLFVPFWHDVVKLPLPVDICVADFQVIDEERLNASLVIPGDKCVVVGYPHGYSASGPEQPTPVALTRFIAASRVADRRQQLLLESIGAPGMSGGPVFVERDDNLLFFGVYTGLIYPDHRQKNPEPAMALGTVADLSILLAGHVPLVQSPSQAHSES